MPETIQEKPKLTEDNLFLHDPYTDRFVEMDLEFIKITPPSETEEEETS